MKSLHLVATTIHCPMMVTPHRDSAKKWQESQILHRDPTPNILLEIPFQLE